MNLNVKLYEQVALVGTVDPLLRDNTTANTDVIDLKNYSRVAFLVGVGATDITVDFAVRQSNNSDGSSDAALSGASVTQWTATDDGKWKWVDVDAIAVKAAGYRYIFGKFTVGDGTLGANCTCVALGLPRYGPATEYDLSDVAEVVAV